MKVGILGAGSIARAMAMAVNGLEGVEGYAVASRDLSKAQAFCDTWGFQKAYGSYEEMLQDPQVELVYVATPHSHHFEHTRLCIEHGKPALVEKAFTANAAQARELIAMAERKGVFLTEAIWVRYMPSRRILRELIDSGIIGSVQRVSADLSYPIPNVKRLTDPSLAGGALLDLGVYVLNFASMVLGDDVQEIKGLTDITRVPFAPEFIKGVINLRGSVLPVIDLKKRLGLEDTPYTANTRIVIVQYDEVAVGMLVDAVTEVRTINADDIDTSRTVTGNDSNSKFISGIGKVDDRLIIQLNLSEIIGLNGEE